MSAIAPCAGRHELYDLALHGDRTASPAAREAARWQAAALCHRCPIAATCTQPVAPPRTRNAHAGRSRGRPLAECGSLPAYRRHLRLGEPVDDACRLANTTRSPVPT